MDGSISESSAGAFEDHLLSCVECASYVEEMSKLKTGLRQLASCKSPVNCWNSIADRIDSSPSPHRFFNSWWKKAAVFVPAAVATAIVAILLILPSFTSDKALDPGSVEGYSQFIRAHSAVQSREPLSDPDLVFATAELENAILVSADSTNEN